MRIKEVEFIKDYKLKIIFSDKSVKVVDLEDFLKKNGGVFSHLRDPEYFKQVAIDDCQLSICWPNGADICPDMLYGLGKDIRFKTIKARKRRSPSKSRASSNKIEQPANIAAKGRH